MKRILAILACVFGLAVVFATFSQNDSHNRLGKGNPSAPDAQALDRASVGKTPNESANSSSPMSSRPEPLVQRDSFREHLTKHPSFPGFRAKGASSIAELWLACHRWLLLNRLSPNKMLGVLQQEINHWTSSHSGELGGKVTVFLLFDLAAHGSQPARETLRQVAEKGPDQLRSDALRWLLYLPPSDEDLPFLIRLARESNQCAINGLVLFYDDKLVAHVLDEIAKIGGDEGTRALARHRLQLLQDLRSDKAASAFARLLGKERNLALQLARAKRRAEFVPSLREWADAQDSDIVRQAKEWSEDRGEGTPVSNAVTIMLERLEKGDPSDMAYIEAIQCIHELGGGLKEHQLLLLERLGLAGDARKAFERNYGLAPN